MAEQPIVLVTGVAGHWGRRLASRLVAEPDYHVLGVDLRPPEQRIEGLDFVPADVRNPLLAELLRAEGVAAVCHLAFVDTTRPDEAAFDLNVMGTANLLTACAEAGVGQVVLKSSTAVYGARPTNSAFLAEGHPLRGDRRRGSIRDLIEIEKLCRDVGRQAPDLVLTILRFASIVGPTADTPMTRFLSRPRAPSLLGFDPRMQLIHEEDVLSALFHALRHPLPGPINVAAEDVLPLNKIRGLVGKPPFPVFHPLAYLGAGLLKRRGHGAAHYLPFELDYLRYPWVADLGRMRHEMGFRPRFTAEETLREFAAQRSVQRHLPAAIPLARDEERLRAIIEQRQRAREPGAEEGKDA